MSLDDQLLAALTLYGLPVLFGVLVVSSAGVPFPVTIMLVVAGSLVEQGEMDLWQVLVVASAAAVLGDQIGYGLGRLYGRRAVERISRRFGGESRIKEAEALAARWGGAGIFLSRWLVTPLGRWLNLTSGIAHYPWHRFLFWDVLGEVLWVVIFVLLGRLFSDRVQALADLAGDLTWALVGLIAAGIFGWKLWQYVRLPKDTTNEHRAALVDPSS